MKVAGVGAIVGEKLMGSLLELTNTKHSSNVIEKCLDAAPVKMRSRMVDEIMQAESFLPMLKDQYGNYVI